MKFIGRTNELKRLNIELKKEGFSFLLIYGRRKIGKRELVKEALKSHSYKSLFFTCKQVSEKSNVKSLAEVASEQLELPQLGYDEIEELLKYLFELAIKKDFCLILDEYTYLRDAVRGMDSILQSLIDNYRERSKIKIIILGSYVDTMKNLIDKSNPLYGRTDCVIELKPMDYYESSLFYSNYSCEDKVRIYSVFGGIPYYNKMIDDSLSVKENIIDLLVDQGARLENEVSNYLSSELSKIANANETIVAMAKGYTKSSDIRDQSHVSSNSTLFDVLEKLIKMEMVEKSVPINDKTEKKTGYTILDNLSLFYYRYIFRYSSQRNVMDAEVFYDKYIREDFEKQFVPHQFEKICKQYLIRMNKAGKIEPVFEEIGKYYYNDPKTKTNGEFDLVTRDENGYIFYEVKFRNTPITNKTIEEEIEQVRKTGLNCYKYGFVSRSGFDCSDRNDVIKISLEELFD